MMRSTDECEMSRSCHKRDVLERGLEIAAQHARQPAELLGLHRVALVGHRARALLLALAEGLLDLADLGALQMPDLGRERLDRRADRCARVQHFGVAVARQHLRRGHGSQPEARANVTLDGRIDVRVRTDRARQLADGDRRRAPRRSRSRSRRTCSAHSASLAPKVVGSAWMPCVRPTIGVSRNSCARSDDRGLERDRGRDDAVERARHLQRERGVDDVARREPVVHPRAGRHADASPARRRRMRRRRGR